jgi:TPR repeat protein
MKYKPKLDVILKNGTAACVLWALMAPWAAAAPEQDTEVAEKEFARGDLVVSMSLWRRAAEQGYAPAQSRLGDILDAAEEDEEAVAWYRKAADQGYAAGEYGLGQMYAKGEGVKKDHEQARIYIVRSAEQGYLFAAVLLMDSYRVGALGFPVDAEKAAAWEAKVVAISPVYKRIPPEEVGAGKKKKKKGGGQ